MPSSFLEPPPRHADSPPHDAPLLAPLRVTDPELTRATDELTMVRAAIDGITAGSGQSYTILGRTMTKADLGLLYERERELLRRIARIDRGGMSIRQIVPL